MKLNIFLLFIFLVSISSAQYRLRLDSLKVDEKIYLDGTDRTPFFQGLNDSNQVGWDQLSPAVKQQVGSGTIENPPDDVTLELKINGSDTTLGIKTQGVHGTAFNQTARDTIGEMINDSTSSLNIYYENALMTAKSGGDYSTIQSAINAASNGQDVLVYPGTYTENITMKDGVTLYGYDRNNTIINGTLTATGNNYISNVKCGDLIISSGDTVNAIDCKIFVEDNYLIDQSGGVINLENCETVFSTGASPVYMTGGKLYIKNSNIRSGKWNISGDSKIYIENCNEYSLYNSGSYLGQLADSSEVHVFNSWLFPVDSNDVYEVGTAYKGIQLSNTSKLYMNKVRYDQIINADDSVTVELYNYTSKYNGRISCAATATAETKIIAKQFYLHMDNGIQFGSHNIEVSSGGTPKYDLSDGTIEYMGDQGDYPMIGCPVAGMGSNSTVENVLFIDHGSDLNVGYSYGNWSIYGIGSTTFSNCTIINNATYDHANGNIGVSAFLQPVIGEIKTKYYDCKVIFAPGNESTRHALYLNETESPDSLLSANDSIVVDINYINADYIANGYWTIDSSEARVKRYALKQQHDIIGYLDVQYNLTIVDTANVQGETFLEDTVTIDKPIFMIGPQDDGYARDNLILHQKSGEVAIDASGGTKDSILITFDIVSDIWQNASYAGNWLDSEIRFRMYRNNNARDIYYGKIEFYVIGEDVLGTDNYALTLTKLHEKSGSTMTDPTVAFVSQTPSGAVHTTEAVIELNNNDGQSYTVVFWSPHSLNARISYD